MSAKAGPDIDESRVAIKSQSYCLDNIKEKTSKLTSLSEFF
jgi:hypothetical protein